MGKRGRRRRAKGPNGAILSERVVVFRLSTEDMARLTMLSSLLGRNRVPATKSRVVRESLKALASAPPSAHDEAGAGSGEADGGRGRGPQLIDRFGVRMTDAERQRLDDLLEARGLGSRTEAIRAGMDALIATLPADFRSLIEEWIADPPLGIDSDPELN